MPPKRSGRPRRAVVIPTAQTKLECCAPGDDAWYSVRIQLEGETLRVSYRGFPETNDVYFPANGFDTIEAIEKLRGRFRAESVQLQDKQCAEVVEGTVVCASNKYGELDLKFYDAVVDSVLRDDRKGHCFCTFNLLWQQGPLIMKKTQARIENICLIHPRGPQMDPILHFFLDIARENFEARNARDHNFSESPRQEIESRNAQDNNFSESPRQEIESMRCGIMSTNTKIDTCSGDKTESLGHEPTESQSYACNIKEMTPVTSVRHRLGGKIQNYQNGAQDYILGSSIERNTNAPECHYFFRVSNLEKDISPVCIMDFIYEQTAVSSVAFVFPTSPAESYATGTIFVETKEEADKLSAFLLNQTQVIMSLRSRPWVTNARWHGSVKGKMPKFEEYFSKGGKEHIGKLNLVTFETEEYVMAKELQKLHNKFHEHIEPLHDSLEIEEKVIASRFRPPATT